MMMGAFEMGFLETLFLRATDYNSVTVFSILVLNRHILIV